MKVAVRKLTLFSCATCHTPAKASFMMRTRRALISSSVQKRLPRLGGAKLALAMLREMRGWELL